MSGRWTGHSGLTGGRGRGAAGVHYHPENGLAGWLDSVAAQHGVVLTVAMRTRQAATAAQLAAAGVGVAIVPRTAITGRFAGVAVPMDPPVGRDLVCLVAHPADSLARCFETAVVSRGVRVS